MMMYSSRKTWVVLSVLFLFSTILFVSSIDMAHGSSTRKHSFDVYLDDERIGLHQVELAKEGELIQITTEADFVYRILMIPVYSYEHRTVETWQGDCLKSIDSKTDDDGDDYFIEGELIGKSLKLNTHDGESSIDGCVRTFAYWDRGLLEQERLLNTQSGEYEKVTFSDRGNSEFRFLSAGVEARKVELDTEQGLIVLWYGESGDWIGLESKVENGSTLRYISSAIGFSLGDDQ